MIAGVNLLGVKVGARLSSAFTIAKLAPLLLFAAAGLIYGFAHPPVTLANQHVATATDWFNASPILLFAYGGFEGALVPMSEARDPQRDVPFAMLVAFLSVTLIYFLVQIVVIRVLPDPAQTDRPLAMAAEVFLGPAGAAFIAISALLALFGYLSVPTWCTFLVQRSRWRNKATFRRCSPRSTIDSEHHTFRFSYVAGVAVGARYHRQFPMERSAIVSVPADYVRAGVCGFIGFAPQTAWRSCLSASVWSDLRRGWYRTDDCSPHTHNSRRARVDVGDGRGCLRELDRHARPHRACRSHSRVVIGADVLSSPAIATLCSLNNKKGELLMRKTMLGVLLLFVAFPGQGASAHGGYRYHSRAGAGVYQGCAEGSQ